MQKLMQYAVFMNCTACVAWNDIDKWRKCLSKSPTSLTLSS